MKPTLGSLKYPAMTLAAAALCVGAGAAPAFAQSEPCADLYSRVMGLYQTAPLSPEYNRVSAYYSSRCLAGPSAGPAYSAPSQPYASSYEAAPPVYLGAVIAGRPDENYRWDSDRKYR